MKNVVIMLPSNYHVTNQNCTTKHVFMCGIIIIPWLAGYA